MSIFIYVTYMSIFVSSEMTKWDTHCQAGVHYDGCVFLSFSPALQLSHLHSDGDLARVRGMVVRGRAEGMVLAIGNGPCLAAEVCMAITAKVLLSTGFLQIHITHDINKNYIFFNQLIS